MALVGIHTQERTRRQWHLLERLGGHFLDVVEGLPTLAVFRRGSDNNRFASSKLPRTVLGDFLETRVNKFLAQSSLSSASTALMRPIRFAFPTLRHRRSLIMGSAGGGVPD